MVSSAERGKISNISEPKSEKAVLHILTHLSYPETILGLHFLHMTLQLHNIHYQFNDMYIVFAVRKSLFKFQVKSRLMGRWVQMLYIIIVAIHTLSKL